ncbi:MAG TPA: exonuclease subunit SbcD [Bacteroidaceae bacterium]|nr:exonuclease subunit SbcD [Bacteroidaceae bacterium]
MKIIITSDWHLGSTFHGTDRLPEQKHFLEWLLSQIESLKPEALLVAGDIFDNGNPSAAAQETYFEFLSKATTSCPGLQTVIIAGNHDSAMRLTAPAALLSKHNIEVRGKVQRNWIHYESEDENSAPGRWEMSVDDLVIPIYNDDKSERVWILALPYVRSSELTQAESYGKGMREIITMLMERVNSLRAPRELVVMIAHLYATGAEIADGSSERILVGGLENVALNDFEEHPDYLASGHIHKRQRIKGTDWARYSGSIMPMSFAEKNNRHGIDLLTTDRDSYDVEFIEYTPQRKLIEIPEEGTVPIEDVIEAINDLPPLDQENPQTMSYINVRMAREEMDMTARKKIEDALSSRHVIFAKLQSVDSNPAQNIQGGRDGETGIRYENLYKRDPMEALTIGFIRENGVEMSDRQIELAQMVIDEARKMETEVNAEV